MRARRAAAAIGAAHQRAQAHVVPGAAVDEARAGEVEDTTAGGAQTLEPLLLVAAERERLVERTGELERAASQSEVRAPDALGLGVAVAEVERGDRRALASAAARGGAVEPSLDRPAELCRGTHAHLGAAKAITARTRHNTGLGISRPMRISA